MHPSGARLRYRRAPLTAATSGAGYEVGDGFVYGTVSRVTARLRQGSRRKRDAHASLVGDARPAATPHRGEPPLLTTPETKGEVRLFQGLGEKAQFIAEWRFL